MQTRYWHIVTMVAFLVLAALSTLSFGEPPTMIPLLDLALVWLAVFRLTHLFVYDTITDFLRNPLKKYRSGLGLSMRQLFDCPWCVGVWMALLVVSSYYMTPWAWYFILILAVAGAGTFLDILARLVLRH